MRRAVLTLILLAWPATLWAQTPDQVALAEEHYQAGLTAFQAGDFGTAAAEFQLSYDLVPKPELLYNASFALARSGEIDAARKLALDALASPLPADVDAKFRARLHGWRAVEQAQKPRHVEVATPMVESPTPPDAVVIVEEPPKPQPEGKGLRIAAFVVGGLGVAGLATAGLMELQLRGVARDLDRSAAQNDSDAYRTALERGHTYQNVGRISLIVGGSLLVTGVILWALSPQKRSEPAVVLRF